MQTMQFFCIKIKICMDISVKSGMITKDTHFGGVTELVRDACKAGNAGCA